MKSEKGITLISLTVYIIGMTIAVAVIAVLSSYFYKNMYASTEDMSLYSEYTKFDAFFSEEVNRNHIQVKACEKDYVVFSNGVQYRFVEGNHGIYRNRVKVCRQVESCTFSSENKNNKEVIIVTMKIKGLEERKIEYTL